MTVWSWGANSYGQLAQGTCDDELLPKKADFPEDTKSIYGGGGHTLVVTDCGKLYTCGSNNKGQLGINTTHDSYTLQNVLIEGSDKVAMAAGGWDFSVAITEASDLYCWGSNAFGQLGDHSLPNKTMLPTKVCAGQKFRQVSAGLRHVVALSDTGDVYCWGHSKKGQCALKTDIPSLKVTSPIKVEFPEGTAKAVSVAAGSYHSIALTVTGHVFIWGCNKFGQCNQDPDIASQVNTPCMINQELFGGQKVTVIKSGWTHIIAQTEDGALYSWGRGDYGQLGRSKAEGSSYSQIPAVIDTMLEVTSFTCGSEHTLFLAGGSVYALGWNEHGLCATGDEINVEKVTKISALDNQIVIYIACGGGHCFAVTEDSDFS